MKTATIQVQVPAWAKWIAQHSDGTWSAFAGMPTRKSKFWDQNGFRSATLAIGFGDSPNWKTTLQKI